MHGTLFISNLSYFVLLSKHYFQSLPLSKKEKFRFILTFSLIEQDHFKLSYRICLHVICVHILFIRNPVKAGPKQTADKMGCRICTRNYVTWALKYEILLGPRGEPPHLYSAAPQELAQKIHTTCREGEGGGSVRSWQTGQGCILAAEATLHSARLHLSPYFTLAAEATLHSARLHLSQYFTLASLAVLQSCTIGRTAYLLLKQYFQNNSYILAS